MIVSQYEFTPVSLICVHMIQTDKDYFYFLAQTKIKQQAIHSTKRASTWQFDPANNGAIVIFQPMIMLALFFFLERSIRPGDPFTLAEYDRRIWIPSLNENVR